VACVGVTFAGGDGSLYGTCTLYSDVEVLSVASEEGSQLEILQKSLASAVPFYGHGFYPADTTTESGKRLMSAR
jgi:hypothetical protein